MSDYSVSFVGKASVEYERDQVVYDGRQDRYVLILDRRDNIKDGRAGFDGAVVERHRGDWQVVEDYDGSAKTVWGYDSQVERVLDRNPSTTNPELLSGNF